MSLFQDSADRWPSLTPSWIQIRTLGGNRFVKSSYFWIVFTPIAAKALQSIESPVNLVILGERIPIHLDLPFSWTLFFLASCFFALASTIYSIRCPPCIKNYSNYTEFQTKSNSYLELYDDSISKDTDLCEVNPHQLLSFAIGSDQYRFYEQQLIDGGPGAVNIHTKLIESPPVDDYFPDVYWFILNGAMLRHPISRVACSCLYATGILFFLWVLAQNIFFVIEGIIE